MSSFYFFFQKYNIFRKKQTKEFLIKISPREERGVSEQNEIIYESPPKIKRKKVMENFNHRSEKNPAKIISIFQSLERNAKSDKKNSYRNLRFSIKTDSKCKNYLLGAEKDENKNLVKKNPYHLNKIFNSEKPIKTKQFFNLRDFHSSKNRIKNSPIKLLSTITNENSPIIKETNINEKNRSSPCMDNNKENSPPKNTLNYELTFLEKIYLEKKELKKLNLDKTKEEDQNFLRITIPSKDFLEETMVQNLKLKGNKRKKNYR